jgi:mannose-6-phosphate isomerase-like protein (cupin superfamily)
MSEMIEQGAVLRNAFNGETFIFSHPLDDPGSASIDVILAHGGSGGGNALLHIHPLANETFAVTSGALEVVIDGESTIVGPGYSATVPRGAPHVFRNAIDGETRFTVTFAPAQQHIRFFANFGLICERHPQWFSSAGDPPLLAMALKFHLYRDHMYLAWPPVILQKLLFALLAPVARLRGYHAEIAPKAQPA